MRVALLRSIWACNNAPSSQLSDGGIGQRQAQQIMHAPTLMLVRVRGAGYSAVGRYCAGQRMVTGYPRSVLRRIAVLVWRCVDMSETPLQSVFQVVQSADLSPLPSSIWSASEPVNDICSDDSACIREWGGGFNRPPTGTTIRAYALRFAMARMPVACIVRARLSTLLSCPLLALVLRGLEVRVVLVAAASM